MSATPPRKELVTALSFSPVPVTQENKERLALQSVWSIYGDRALLSFMKHLSAKFQPFGMVEIHQIMTTLLLDS
jgi:hypothetical protein